MFWKKKNMDIEYFGKNAQELNERHKADQLLAEHNAKVIRERRLEQLDADIVDLLSRSHIAPMLGLSAWLNNDMFFGNDRRAAGSYSRAKEVFMRLVNDLISAPEPKKKAKK